MRKLRSIIVLLILPLAVLAQTDLKAQMPVDPNVKIGILPNGLTYYIRHNALPKDRAYFYIAQKVGAIQENPDQRGLAHFLEHMCFNGTTHFPGSSLRGYLERIGVKFGQDLNAYTAVDETVYNIDNVPTNVKGAVDSCLLILHDWSHDLTLDPEEIDKERGIIQEEWRTRNTANQRMNEAMMPVIMAGSKYADCMPIGSMDIVMKFKPEALRRYYEKWYRPDLQGIVVVGDIDVNEVEQKIKNTFADIPAPGKKAAKREYYPVATNKKPIVWVGTDKESSLTYVQIYYKHPAASREEKNTAGVQLNKVLDSYIGDMFHDRTVEYVQKPGAPFTLCAGKNSGYFLAQTMEAFHPYVNCHQTRAGLKQGIFAMVAEVERIRRHGFTQTEVDRQVKGTMTSLESLYRDRDKRYSSQYVNEYVRNFLDNEPISGIEYEYNMWKELLSNLKAEDVNRRFNSYFEGGNAPVITVTMANKDTIPIPSEKEILAIYEEACKQKVGPYNDNVSSLPMLPEQPVAGKIVKEGVDPEDSLYKMECSNGAKIVVMKTDHRKDQIMLTAAARGGLSLYEPEWHKWSNYFNFHPQVTGLGNWTLLQKNKALSDVKASASTALSDNYSAVTGSCSPQFLGSMMEQVYAAFRFPNKDPEAFGALRTRLAKDMRNREKQPGRMFGKYQQMALYEDDPYVQELKAKEVENLDYDAFLEQLKKPFEDASAFTFFFIGNVNIDSLRPYVEKYVASLPSTYSNPKEKPILAIKPGKRIIDFTDSLETPTARIFMELTTHPKEYNLKNYLTASLLGNVLTILYTKTIREEAGAAYSVSAGAQQHMWPARYARLMVRFPTSPENKDKALQLVRDGMKQVAEQGPDLEALDKSKKSLISIYEGNQTANAYWNFVLINKWFSGLDMSKDYVETVNSITADDVKQLMQELLQSGNEVTVTMSTPVSK